MTHKHKPNYAATKNKRNWIRDGYCKETGKESFKSKKLAKKRVNELLLFDAKKDKDARKRYIYKCPFCHNIHLTKQKQR